MSSSYCRHYIITGGYTRLSSWLLLVLSLVLLLYPSSVRQCGGLEQLGCALLQEVKLLIPNSLRINRGGLVLGDVVETARAKGMTDIVVLHEHRGEPDGLIVCHLPYGPTAYFGIHNAVLRHDIGARREVGTMSEAYPHLIFDNFTTPLGRRCCTILKHLFPVPKPDTKRVVSFINVDDYVCFRHHTYDMPNGAKSCDLTEVGPRWEMRLYQVRLGTLDQNHAENEYVMRAYIRSNKRLRLCEAQQPSTF